MNDDVLQGNIEIALRKAGAADARRGRDLGSSACFACGTTAGSIARCTCAFPEILGCAGGRFFCDEHRDAHRSVCSFLTEIFRTHPSGSARSRRARLHLRFYRAFEGLEGGDVARRILAQTDGGDGDDNFRAVVGRAFAKSLFLDFAGLAAGLKRELDRECFNSLVRSIHLRMPGSGALNMLMNFANRKIGARC